ncbi:MAG: hypothetical protein AB8B94_08295 [Hyphomicrobiales bacterium]
MGTAEPEYIEAAQIVAADIAEPRDTFVVRPALEQVVAALLEHG